MAMPGHHGKNPRGISSKITKRTLEHALGKRSDSYFFAATGIILILCIMLAVLVFNWGAGIKPPPVQPEISVSVTRLNQSHISVMVFSIQHKDTVIRYLVYNTSGGTGFVNKSTDSFDFVRDVGEYGTIHVSGYNEYLEIKAVLDNAKTIGLYRGKI